MGKPTDVSPVRTSLHWLALSLRMPLKFGPETVTDVTCARTSVVVADSAGRTAIGWGETPLSVQWVWPSPLAYEPRHQALKQFCVELAEAWAKFDLSGHPIEIGDVFKQHVLPGLLTAFNADRRDPMPYLAALVCCSPFDIALHDAYGNLHGRPIYELYTREFLSRDLASFLTPAPGESTRFQGLFPGDLLVQPAPRRLRAWHLIGGLDPLNASDLTGDEPDDGHPVMLSDWIKTDGLKCLKVKLRGNDDAWDFERLTKTGRIALEHDVDWLTADFNCTVTEPAYVNEILDRLRDEHPRLYGMILYVEQPFPYELDRHPIDVHSVSARKPLFMDESAHDWKLIERGRSLGWTGVALKTCKTQTGAILALCWAKAHGMALMVQDLTNPMLAQIPHVLLAAHAGTIMGVETNAMQFYPEASGPEAQLHPDLYRRRDGCIDWSTVEGPGFGYRVNQIDRKLPPAVALFG